MARAGARCHVFRRSAKTSRCTDGVGLRHHIGVMEAKVGKSQLGEKIECLAKLQICRGLVERAAVPGPLEGAGTEHVKSVPIKGVPVAYRHAQVLLHGFAEDDAVFVVVTIGQWLMGIRAFESNGGDVAEV